jgi:hypothetical protein
MKEGTDNIDNTDELPNKHSATHHPKELVSCTCCGPNYNMEVYLGCSPRSYAGQIIRSWSVYVTL